MRRNYRGCRYSRVQLRLTLPRHSTGIPHVLPRYSPTYAVGPYSNVRIVNIDAEDFGRVWAEAWNAHDVESVLKLFHQDVVFTSPVALRLLPETGGIIQGKTSLRAYWATALQAMHDLKFSIEAVYEGINSLVIAYKNQDEKRVSEVLIFGDDNLIIEGHGTYVSSLG